MRNEGLKQGMTEWGGGKKGLPTVDGGVRCQKKGKCLVSIRVLRQQHRHLVARGSAFRHHVTAQTQARGRVVHVINLVDRSRQFSDRLVDRSRQFSDRLVDRSRQFSD